MPHVFISFVEENHKVAAWIVRQMRANGLDPWFSKDEGRIVAGDQWKQTLREAIRDGGFYVPLFSQEWADRNRTVANEELTIAVEEARLRGLHRRWFVPVKLGSADLPGIDLGAGLALTDIHYVDVQRLGWNRGLRDLLRSLGIENPTIEEGEPLALGFGSNIEVTGGFLTYRNTNPFIAELEGVHFTVTHGAARREDDGRITAQFFLRAPYESLQSLNQELGLDRIDVRTDDKVISTDPAQPTRFYYVDPKDQRPVGSPLWMLGEKPLQTDVPIEQVTGYEAVGYINPQDRLVGTFNGYIETASPLGMVRVTFDGDFDLAIRSIVAPPA